MAGTFVERRWVLPAAAGVVSTVEFARVVSIVGQRITNSDATTLWYAASEWTHFRWHEPGFFGQSYGSNLAGIPIAILHSLGVGYPTATPLVLGASMLVLWFALAWAFAQRGHWVVATLAAAMPALLSAYYAVYVTSVTFERAFALVGLGVAVLIARRSSAVLLGVGVAVAGVGLAIDVSAALLVVPVVVWTVLDRPPTKREWIAVGIGGAIAGGYFVAATAFYRIHPENNLHGALPLQLSVDLLDKSTERLEPRFRLFTPELFRTHWIPITLGIVLVILLLATRRLRYVLPAVACVLLVVLALSSPRATDSGGVFFTSGRLLLLFPAVLVFLVLLLADSGRFQRFARLGAVLIALALVGSVLTRFFDDEHVPARLREQALISLGYSFTDVDEVERQCRHLDGFADAMDARVAALTANGLLAMGCGPLVGSSLQTVDIPYDRRTWRLDRLASEDSTAAVLSSTGPGFCRVAGARFRSCERRGTLAIVRYDPQSLLNVLAQLDMPVRPFGPGCVITGFACSSGTDTRSRFPVNRGRLDGAQRAAVLASVRSLNLGDASAGELRAHDGSRSAISRLLARRPISVLGEPFRIGPTTAAVELRIPTRDGHRRILGHLVRSGDRWKVATTTECALAVANGIACASSVPTLFPGLIWSP